MRLFTNTAPPTRLAGALTSGATTINVDSTAGWPTPTGADVGLGCLTYPNADTLELFTYTGKTATSFTGVVRGVDDTDPKAHLNRALVVHVASWTDFSGGGDVSALPTFASGTYTPTLTATANVASSIVQDCRYIRIGNQVFVSGRVSITPTAATTATRWRITLPIASNIGADNDVAGSGAGDQTDESACNIRGDATNDAARFECAPASTAQHLYAFTFGYTVI